MRDVVTSLLLGVALAVGFWYLTQVGGPRKHPEPTYPPGVVQVEMSDADLARCP